MSKNKKVYVGMSGGVDSSVSAALLKEQGYDVTGVFIRTWQPDFLACDWREERQDAMRVAAGLGIQFETLDLQKEYKRDVADYMISEYQAGRTPNPDVMCNATIKFGAFFDWAMEQGADYVATGHYARLRRMTNDKTQMSKKSQNTELLAGIDTNKDQTYFLWKLSQDILAKTLFPVGEFEKSEVRKLAEKFKLPVAQKKDSQGVCFLGKIDMKEFLEHYVETEQGEVLDESGEVIGHHDGALFFTLGQRHGFTLTKRTPNDKPRYVVAKDMDANTITVSETGNPTDLETQSEFATETITIAECNWNTAEVPEIGTEYQARIRYRQPLQLCTIAECQNPNDTCQIEIQFNTAQKGVAKGQSLVLYDGEQCLGGGVIQ